MLVIICYYCVSQYLSRQTTWKEKFTCHSPVRTESSQKHHLLLQKKKNKKWGKQLRILLNVWIYSLPKYNASAAESETWILNI